MSFLVKRLWSVADSQPSLVFVCLFVCVTWTVLKNSDKLLRGFLSLVLSDVFLVTRL